MRGHIAVARRLSEVQPPCIEPKLSLAVNKAALRRGVMLLSGQVSCRIEKRDVNMLHFGFFANLSKKLTF